MLNELIQAAKALEEHSIAVRTFHPALKALPKYPTYKVLVAVDGAVADVRPWTNDITNLRKWQIGENGYSFPVFNVKPLHPPILDEALNEEITRWSNGSTSNRGWPEVFADLEQACDKSLGTWMITDKKKRTQMVRVYSKSLDDGPRTLAKMLADCRLQHKVLSTLTDRLTKHTPETFFDGLDRLLREKLRQGFDASLMSMFCAASNAEAKQSMNVMLDLPDWAEIAEYPVTHKSTGDFLNELLTVRDAVGQESEEGEALDAFGKPSKGSGEKYPEVNVPGLGPIKLRTMFEEAECQKRYGHIDAQSFIAGKDSRVRATGALDWLKQPDHKGKTWQWFRPTLVLLYPEMPLKEFIDADLADFCSLPEQDDDAGTNSEASFVARAERIALAFQGKPRESEVPIHLIVLRKASKGQTKLVSHHHFTPSHLIESAKRWGTGAVRCPPISFARWSKERGKREDIVPEVPFPGEVVNWLNTFWVRNGESQGKLSTFRLEDALTLLLADDGTEKPLATHAIRQAVANWSGFLATHGADQRSALVLKSTDKRSGALRCLPAILSLLLCKLGHTKEQTMSSPAFLVGRLLALADALHFQYCHGVRNGSVPPQLLGNALMQTALETPQSALALYAQRILPYQAWAATARTAEHDNEDTKKVIGLAKWLLGQLGGTCAQVALTDIPERASDADKAQMILGYLAKTKTDD